MKYKCIVESSIKHHNPNPYTVTGNISTVTDKISSHWQFINSHWQYINSHWQYIKSLTVYQVTDNISTVTDNISTVTDNISSHWQYINSHWQYIKSLTIYQQLLTIYIVSTVTDSLSLFQWHQNKWLFHFVCDFKLWNDFVVFSTTLFLLKICIFFYLQHAQRVLARNHLGRCFFAVKCRWYVIKSP
jgi:hypothetical protein